MTALEHLLREPAERFRGARLDLGLVEAPRHAPGSWSAHLGPHARAALLLFGQDPLGRADLARRAGGWRTARVRTVLDRLRSSGLLRLVAGGAPGERSLFTLSDLGEAVQTACRLEDEARAWLARPVGATGTGDQP